jgi:hypothetical protein
MAKQQIECQFGIGGIVFGPARFERLTVFCERRGINRKQDQEVVFLKRGDYWSPRQLSAFRDGIHFFCAVAKGVRDRSG